MIGCNSLCLINLKMVEQLLNLDILKKKGQINESSEFENLIELTNQLFDTPFITICSIDNQVFIFYEDLISIYCQT